MDGAVPPAAVVAAVAATVGAGVGCPERTGILVPTQRWWGLRARRPVEAIGGWVAAGGWGAAGD